MNRFRLSTACALVIASSSLSAPAQERPRIGYVFPAGGRQGTTFLVTVGGQNLGSWKGDYQIDVLQVHFSGGGIKAELVKDVKTMTEQEASVLREKANKLARDKPDAEVRKEIAQIRRKITRYQSSQVVRQTYPAVGDTLTVRVALAADAEPGQREIRVETPRGISNPIRFYVGSLPEFTKAEPDIVADQQDSEIPSYAPPVTTPITLPAVVNGQIIPRDPDMLYFSPDRFTPGTADRFRFQARKGQQLVIAASARELIPYLADAVPGWFQATLALYDCAGKRAGLRRRLPVPSRSRTVLQGPRGRTVRDRDQGRDLPRPARFRLSHQPGRASLHYGRSSRWAAGPARRPPSSSPAGTCQPTR